METGPMEQVSTTHDTVCDLWFSNSTLRMRLKSVFFPLKELEMIHEKTGTSAFPNK